MPSDWHGDEFFEGVRTRLMGGVAQAAADLRISFQQLIGTQGPPRSQPGESPHRDSGDLQASLQVIGPEENGDTIVASIGTALGYGRALQFGTKTMGARPWLDRGLLQNQDKIARTIVGNNAEAIVGKV